jgi:hypothetical protein
MRKISILTAVLLFTLTAMSQKPNPTIGKSEFEISLLYHAGQKDVINKQHLAGGQMVYRWSWKKYTKVGVGGLVGVQDYDPILESDVVPYGALFGDITQFIGKRQKWSVSGQIGHGIFKRERKREGANSREVDKHTAGMYYSISFNYRSIISKKILIVVSPAYTFRNFRQKLTGEIYSPPSVNEYTSTDKYSGLGLRLGVVF